MKKINIADRHAREEVEGDSTKSYKTLQIIQVAEAALYLFPGPIRKRGTEREAGPVHLQRTLQE